MTHERERVGWKETMHVWNGRHVSALLRRAANESNYPAWI
jgi:hypothetical protein